MTIIRKLLRDSRGATAIEYALIASLISIAGASAFANLGTKVSGKFTTVETKVSTSM